jgi:hypothetical protein
VTDGIFNCLIGSGTVSAGTEDGLVEVFRNNTGVWMTTEVNTDGEMTPRKLIGSVGYAVKSDEAETAQNAINLSHIEPVATAPANPVEGDVYMDSTTHKLMVYDGSTWQACW